MVHSGGDDISEKEWLFDYLLSVFKSPEWDIAVMGFIDENCAVFDNDEENKLSYTELHHQFKDLVETLCSSSLAEVGVAVGDFVDALEASRLSQEISTAVYEQLVALDDFVTFKKLMVKRNVELELEAVRALQEQGVPFRQDSANDSASCEEGERDRETAEREEFAVSICSELTPRRGRNKLDRQLQKAMDANLRELELMHKREEVEQAELEQAIAMSLALEVKGEKLDIQQEYGSSYFECRERGITVGRAKCATPGEESCGPRYGAVDVETDFKGEAAGDRECSERRPQSKEEEASRGGGAMAESKCDFSGGAEEKNSACDPRKRAGSKTLPPLSMTRGENAAPFRGGSGEGGECFRAPGAESSERRREARMVSEKSKKFLEERRRAQEVLKAQSDVSEEECAQRERHLKDLRDRIVSAKRMGREEEAAKAVATKLLAQPRVGGAAATQAPEKRLAGGKPERCGSKAGDGDDKRGDEDVLVISGEGVEEDFAEEQRRTMRVALASHMKRELLENEQERLTKLQEEQIADLHGKLRLVEKLRDENSEREAEIARVLRQQQQKRARNVASSAASVEGINDEFTFGVSG